MNPSAGRSCPLAYRYGAAALATASTRPVETLYVVGGLYGNPFALDCIQALAEAEPVPATICFNGDFNWFNVDDEGFHAINQAVLQHHATLGNVEFEFASAQDLAGCGCAYPATVAQGVVERSNRIHARLKNTAHRHPDILAQLAALPLFARYQIGAIRISVVHGDADSLAGWQFDGAALDQPGNESKIVAAFGAAEVDIFASSHTCQPALRRFQLSQGQGVIANNGAAGMPNFRGQRAGLLTRISLHVSPHRPIYGMELGQVRVDALPIAYDDKRWRQHFLSNWPEGSDAHRSYFERIAQGPEYRVSQAVRRNI